MRVIDTNKSLTDVVIFDGVSNVQLPDGILKIYYPKLTAMRRFEHTISLLFNDISKYK